MSPTSRIIVLVDMDCFYCQVEEKLNPELKGKPVAVVQYNEWRGGGIIAVNYEARAKGVTRHMRGNDAKEVCPDINLVNVPQIRGKADLNKYREAGKQVAEVLQSFTPLLERASVDEAYLNISETVQKRIDERVCKITLDQLQNTFVVGSETKDFIFLLEEMKNYDDSKFRLAVGGVIAEEMRAEVFRITGYRCSAGVAHNKILAKLVCGLHKPNKQTLLPQDAVPLLYKDLPVKKIKGFGGKFGEEVSQILNITKMGELSKFSEKELAKHFDEKAANWLYNIARGIDHEPVTVRLISKSIGCSKNFLGKNALVTEDSIAHWLSELVSELSERLEKDMEENNRKAKTMIINFSSVVDRKNVSASRTCQINSYDTNKLIEKAMDVLNKNCRKNDGTYKITHLGFSLGNFEDVKNVRSIATFFKNMESNRKSTPNLDKNVPVLDGTDVKVDKELCATQTKMAELSKNLSSFDQAKLLESSTFLESDSESSNDANSSIYSICTIPENQNIKENVAYFDSVRPESVADQSFPEYENQKENTSNFSSSSVDSISADLCKVKHPNIAENIPRPSSFFQNYFSNNNNDQRDFDTSKMLGECSEAESTSIEEESDLNDNKEMEISLKPEHKIDITNDFSTNSPKNLESSARKVQIEKKYDFSSLVDSPKSRDGFSGKETCQQCGKAFPSEEFTSHMDYHFALRIVKSEAHLYNVPNNTTALKSSVKNKGKEVISSSKENKSKSKHLKRKSNENSETTPISNFFKQEESLVDSIEDTELCPECNKRIKIEDFPSHLDFHMAKKLHLELNAQNFKTKSPVKSKVVSDSNLKKKSKPVKSGGSIASFFKKQGS